MIDLDTYPIFSSHHSNLRKLSLDDGKGQKIYMTQSTRDAVNFDAVKKEYIKSLGLSKVPSSNDALFDDGRGLLVFVEFKNGFISRKKKLEIWKKLYDSTLIFADITSTGISYMRSNMKYILVYNETVNQDNDLDEDLKKKRKTAVQPSPAFDAFAKNVGKYANEEYVCFGLIIFQNYCFKEVHTYTETEFDAYLSTL
ncbi:hypothetical protein CLOSCI_03286 [[Clostridium] scindens ATCC 35704]|uniref:Uncharacterized protein n=1 Tax=Clostridium scindens (strain ATCC 35704 / DSM 5676 / VPI 13733 / 19) TaxID=411468 RepID=B0NIG7_CLOS5|nr:hypothetical protein [[Clostridium] scindens]EDS05631.1 hypothetical protein CLOSCI_03286 [[Clostridium] scindens ATCC 35704]QBF74422.1 hypothetical protein HDCHBGLK_01824 [[Clostridium] scindens ATCC 35704]QRO37658.1 hypothetical protein I6J57_02975 [[Clostridium] scindens]WPB37169.1 hypothetical protein PBLEJBOC_01881 [[Clostridium] scindens]BDF15368.1 hypothetical protein CE91St59_06310 [[Clostridium] scindens]